MASGVLIDLASIQIQLVLRNFNLVIICRVKLIFFFRLTLLIVMVRQVGGKFLLIGLLFVLIIIQLAIYSIDLIYTLSASTWVPPTRCVDVLIGINLSEHILRACTMVNTKLIVTR